MSQEPQYSDSHITRILQTTKTIAMIGVSSNIMRPSFFALQYLLSKGYDIYPVNPAHAGGRIAGRLVYGKLTEIPVGVDLVDIFRQAQYVPDLVRQAILIGAKTIWMQLGIRHDEAAKQAQKAGLTVIMNRCPKIEYGRLSRDIAMIGVNSQRISARRMPILGKISNKKNS